MKLPGKRERKRRASERNQALPGANAPSSSPPPVASPAQQPPASPPPVLSAGNPPTRGGAPPPASKRLVPPLLVGGILLFLGIVPVVSLVSSSKRNDPESAATKIDPLPSADSGSALTAASAAQRRTSEPSREPVYPGNGYESFLAAIAQTPPLGPTEAHDVNRLVTDPTAKLGKDGLRWVRQAWPAVKLLQQAACSTAFTHSGAAPLDVQRVQSLAVAALATARLQTESRPTDAVGRWAVRLVRLGHALAQGSDPIESLGALSLARIGERWLRSSLQQREWSTAERTWAREQLAPVLDGARARPPSVAPVDSNDRLAAGLAKTSAAEKQALEDVMRLVTNSSKSERH